MNIKTPQQNIFYIGAAATALWLSGAIWQKVCADEAALYDKAPSDAAFVRLLNTQDRALQLSLGGKRLSVSGFCRASDYVYLKAGLYRLEDELTQGWRGRLEAGKVYSLVTSNTGVRLLSESLFVDPRRAQLSVYNLAQAGALDIKTSQEAQQVFSKLSAGASQSRSVNPIKVSLSVFSHGGDVGLTSMKLADAGMTILQAGSTSSLLVCSRASDAQGNTETHWVSH